MAKNKQITQKEKDFMENEPIKITVVDDGRTIVLDTPWDSDLGDWEDNFKIILKWLTFSEEQINELFSDTSMEEQ